MVATAHWADRFLLVDLTADEISRTAGRRRFAPGRAPVLTQQYPPAYIRHAWADLAPSYIHLHRAGKPQRRPGRGHCDSATSMVAAPHWGDGSLSVDLTADEISRTAGRRRFARAGHLLFLTPR